MKPWSLGFLVPGVHLCAIQWQVFMLHAHEMCSDSTSLGMLPGPPRVNLSTWDRIQHTDLRTALAATHANAVYLAKWNISQAHHGH